MRFPTAAQKRALANLSDPMLAVLQRGYRAGWRRGAVPVDLADPAACRQVRRVLAVRLDAIGDLLLTEPALGILRQRFPEARIDLVANPASAAVLEGNPNIDRLVRYSAPWHAAWRGGAVDWKREAARAWGVTEALRGEHYELGFELRGDLRDIGFTAAAGPGMLIGSGFRGGKGLLDIDVPFAPRGHQVELSAAIAGYGSPLANIRAPRVHLTSRQMERSRQAMPDSTGPCIALHLGAGFESKRLPIETVAAVVDRLAANRPGLNFVVVGAGDEQELETQLRGTVRRPERLFSLVGRLGLLETAAVLSRCTLFIGNDSAPMHLAAAAGTPVVACFGPSEPWKFHPYGVPYRLLEVPLDCRPCDYVHCIWGGPQKFQCMGRQDPASIAAAAEELLVGG
ncbi:MAG: glycosyltransferase family 9 protein [Dehalococcoidia bacterium]|nr:glycosyltransferase family 9 protein [Dehalococcoidia bacterium]